MLVTYKFRLKDKHATELNRQARAVNYVWNYCNETQTKAARDRRRWLNWIDLKGLTAGSYKELDLHSATIQMVCLGYVRSRSKRNRPWLRYRGRKSPGWVPFSTGTVSVAGVGKIKFRRAIYETMHWRDFPKAAVMRMGSFNSDARGRWYINITAEAPDVQKSSADPIGIDLGLKHLATLSDGRKVIAPNFYRKSEKALAIAQRARRARRARAIHSKVANRRKDFLHKASSEIAKRHSTIVVGDVSPSQMSQTGIGKSVHDIGWSTFRRMLSYKAMRHGGKFVEAKEHMTSRTCSCCGNAASGPKGIAGLGIREWTCGDCGATHDRDVNAARNILARGLASLAEGALS